MNRMTSEENFPFFGVALMSLGISFLISSISYFCFMGTLADVGPERRYTWVSVIGLGVCGAKYLFEDIDKKRVMNPLLPFCLGWGLVALPISIWGLIFVTTIPEAIFKYPVETYQLAIGFSLGVMAVKGMWSEIKAEK